MLTAPNTHGGEKTRLFVSVWAYLLVLTAVEVALGYTQLFSTRAMLLILMVLSVCKAGLIVAYFMHLRFEKPALRYSLIPACVLVIALLFAFFPDSFRLLELRAR
ncbi:MAG TPA: cytochrome C oxidase subunit IV family protein [Anaerolineales bacterium]